MCARVRRPDGPNERNYGSGGKTAATGFNLACAHATGRSLSCPIGGARLALPFRHHLLPRWTASSPGARRNRTHGGKGYIAVLEAAPSLLGVARVALGGCDGVEPGVTNRPCQEGTRPAPAAIKGTIQLIMKVFGERGKRARKWIGASDLSGHAPVVIELILEARRQGMPFSHPPAPSLRCRWWFSHSLTHIRGRHSVLLCSGG